jgi:hypothetical protein
VNLLKLSSAELNNMDKKEVHEGYKKIMAVMLMDFYIQCSNHFDSGNNITVKALTDYIEEWMEKKIKKQPAEDWNPGDSGK